MGESSGMHRPYLSRTLRVVLALMPFACVAIAAGRLSGAAAATAPYASGDLVRLARKETVMFKGEPFLSGPKGQEFTVLKHELAKGQVYLAFVQKEGEVIAVTLPDTALELVPPDGWALWLRGTQAFRDQRFDDARKLLARAVQDPAFKAGASGVALRIESVMQAAGPALQSRGGPAQKAFVDALSLGRDVAADVFQKGYTSVAQALEEGLDRLAARVLAQKEDLPPSKMPREELANRAAQAAFSVVRCRQAMAVRRMVEARGYIEAGLKAEPARPELKAMLVKVEEEIKDAENRGDSAESNRRRNLGQALLALERGLKLCADHPRLLKLREEMSGALEERTAPPVTPEFIAAAKPSAPAERLEQGRQLYTTRCTQCHDLEMLDSRTIANWKSEVAGMARRAKVDDNQQNVIMDYLAAAHAVVGANRKPQ
jgi:cytochrome c5